MKIKFQVVYDWDCEDNRLYYTIDLCIPNPVPEEYSRLDKLLEDWSEDSFSDLEKYRRIQKLDNISYFDSPERTFMLAQEKVKNIIKDVVEKLKQTKELNMKMKKLSKPEIYEYDI